MLAIKYLQSTQSVNVDILFAIVYLTAAFIQVIYSIQLILCIVLFVTSCKYPSSGRSFLSPAGLYSLGPCGPL